MSEKIAISRETLTVLADEHCPYGLLMAAKAIVRDLLSKPPLISALHENGDLIALQATVAQQAKMIEHLRGGPTPLYTAVDMANAARDRFRDGAASVVVELPSRQSLTVDLEMMNDPDGDYLDYEKAVAAIIAAGGRVKE
jgi:hypothetical protein